MYCSDYSTKIRISELLPHTYFCRPIISFDDVNSGGECVDTLPITGRKDMNSGYGVNRVITRFVRKDFL